MIMQDYKNSPHVYVGPPPLEHALDRMAISVRRLTVSILRSTGHGSAAYERAKNRRAIKRDYLAKVYANILNEGKWGRS